MDVISYLSPNITNLGAAQSDVLFSKLLACLHETKQNKANKQQWIGLINGFSQKGVKLAEIEDSSVLAFLGTKNDDQKIEQIDLLSFVASRLPRIKCVNLGSPKYRDWVNLQDSNYTERLYILSSEGMVADDQMEDLLYRIEALGFNPGPLMDDPELVDRLENEMNLLKSVRPDMYDFSAHHFSSQVQVHGKNLMAHARTSQTGDIFFIEEIQSDWAQKGRRADWTSGYPKAPFVTNTEQWAGIVLRDLMHQAANNPACKQVAWINSSMRNGWEQREHDDLSVFYDTIIKKIALKTIEKAGGRVSYRDVTTKNGVKSVQGFEMTDSVRAALLKPLPMYSREALLPRGLEIPDPERTQEKADVLSDCRSMLGSAYTIRFVAKLYDVAQGTEVAGQYLQSGIELSLRAKNLNRVARHEAWHFANENFLLAHEKRELRLAFSPGSALNEKTQMVLRSLGENDAALQCQDPQECTAHAFALWCDNLLEMTPAPKSIFEKVINALERTSDWLEEKIFGVQVKKPDDLFQAMRDGALARRQQRQHEEAIDFPPMG